MPDVSMRDPAWRPSPRAWHLWAINAALLWAAVLAVQGIWVLGGAPLTVRGHLLLLLATLVLAIAHIGVVPSWRWRVHRWEISDTAVYTRTGWFMQELRIAPISRVQSVDTERGPIDRLLGLATVTVTTASSAGAVTIPALDLPMAERTAAVLTEIAARQRGDAT